MLTVMIQVMGAADNLGAGFNRNGAGDSRTQADKVQDTLRF